MDIYKFRKLSSEIDCCRLKEIIETGHFWCSDFWELNDPMEGLFFLDEANKGKAESIVREIFKQKEDYKICSFSGEKGFNNPAMWGYYTDGFRGVAIKLEVKIKEDKDDCGAFGGVKKVIPNNNMPDASNIEKILSNKNLAWGHEDEYRFLIKSGDKNYHGIEKITAIYFGNPYGDITNIEDVRSKSSSIREYEKFKEKIKKVALGIGIRRYNVKNELGKVEAGEELYI